MAEINTDSTSQDEFDRLLDNFIAKQLSETEDTIEDLSATKEAGKPMPKTPMPADEAAPNLFQEERQLYDAYCNFRSAVTEIATSAAIDVPEFKFSADQLYPRFRPSRIKNLNHDIFESWKTITIAQPVRLASLPENPSDEQILSFAEKTTDENLQNALISYVETLIEVDGCEIAYNLRKANAEKRKIEKAIYEEHLRRKETMARFIEEIRKQNFPIDAERLVNNFFKTARKDPNGAKQILENNPATYAPIQVEKIPPRLFGLIKAKPEDGIRVNKEIGKFLKNLKA